MSLVFAGGCRAKQLGLQVSSTRAARVDASWVVAARNCWPALKDDTDKGVAAALLDPIAFRGAFPAYGELSDSEVEAVATAPVAAAPAPAMNVFRNTSEMVLSRPQATTAGLKLDRSSPQAHDAANLPDDALCVVHNGTPVGFK